MSHLRANEEFHIVMSLDRVGPREHNGGQYFRHETEAAAIAEAHRLATLHRGRFAVLSVHHVIAHHIEVRSGTDPVNGTIPF